MSQKRPPPSGPASSAFATGVGTSSWPTVMADIWTATNAAPTAIEARIAHRVSAAAGPNAGLLGKSRMKSHRNAGRNASHPHPHPLGGDVSSAAAGQVGHLPV